MKMKKVLALLLACMTLTCTFASCGDSDDDDKDTKTKRSASADDDEDEDGNDDDDDEEEDDNEDDKKSNKDKDDDDDDEDSKSDKNDNSKTDKKDDEESSKADVVDGSRDVDDSEVLGAWLIGDVGTGMDAGVVINDDGTISVRVEATSMMYFDGRSLYISGMELGEEYINYDGDTIAIDIEGEDLMTLSRRAGTKGSKSNYDGIYDFTSGVMYDAMVEAFVDGTNGLGSVKCSAIIDGDEMFIDFENLIKYTGGNGKATISGDTDMLGDLDFDGGEISYYVENNKLVLDNGQGVTLELQRWD